MLSIKSSQFFLVLLAIAPTVWAQEFDVINLSQTCGMYAKALNNNGTAVGYIGFGDSRPAVFDGTTCFQVDRKAATLNAVNDNNQIMGQGYKGNPYAPIGGQLTPQFKPIEIVIDPSNKLNGEGSGTAINNQGLAAGTYSDYMRSSDGWEIPFVVTGQKKAKPLPLDPTAVSGIVRSMNELGEIVGLSGAIVEFDCGGGGVCATMGPRPTIWRGDSVRLLSSVNQFPYGQVMDINNHSVAVGLSSAQLIYPPGSLVIPTVWDASGNPTALSMSDHIDFRNSRIALANSINDCGYIVGTSTVDGGLIWTPDGRRLNLMDLINAVPYATNNIYPGEALSINNRGQILASLFGSGETIILTPKAGSEFDMHCGSEINQPGYSYAKLQSAPRNFVTARAQLKKRLRHFKRQFHIH